MNRSGDDEPSDRAPPRPSPPKRPRESIVIEGKASELYRNRPRRTPSSVAEWARDPRWAVSAAGGLVGALAALGGVWLIASGPDMAQLLRHLETQEATQARLVAVEADAKAAANERQALAERLAQIQTALRAPPPGPGAKGEDRIAAVENGQRAAQAERQALADKAQALQSTVATLQSEAVAFSEAATAAAAERKSLADEVTRLGGAKSAAYSALEARITTLEAMMLRSQSEAARAAADKALAVAGAPKSDPRFDRAADEMTRLSESVAADRDERAALRDRLDKLETILFAPKTETRAGPSATGESLTARPTARAVAALALAQRLQAGEPIANELAALERMGVDAASLAALRPFASRAAPTITALALDFRELEPQFRDAARAPSMSSGVARWLGEFQGLVKIRKVGESYGAEAGKDAARVEGALARGELDNALAALRTAPEAAQAAARAWAEAAEARLAADRAAEALMVKAVADLGGANR